MTGRARNLLTVALVFLALAQTSAARADVPAGTPFVDSASLPIRVYYDASFTEAKAQAVLPVAEAQWRAQVQQMGFAAPLRKVDGVVGEGLALYVYVTRPVAGISAVADVPGTPRSECATVAAFDSQWAQTRAYTNYVVGHVLNHAALFATDCIEPNWAVELFQMATLATEGGPIAQEMFQEALVQFQAAPEQSLVDATNIWGAALFPLYAEEKFGSRDGKLLAQMWAGTAQNGTVTSFGDYGAYPVADVANKPHFLDAMDATLKTHGSSLDQAFEDFAVWRTLTGTHADGRHFQGASGYPEVALAAQHGVMVLPLVNQHPPKRVGPYGSSHILLDLAGATADKALVLAVGGSGPHRWAADAVCLKPGADAEVVRLSFDAARLNGTAAISSVSRCRFVELVVANLSDGSFDPNVQGAIQPGDFSYSIAFVPNPSLVSVEPSSLPRGSRSQTVLVRGTHLESGPALAAAFSGAGVLVESVESSDDSAISLTVSVDEAAELGTRGLTVTSGLGVTSTLGAALTVTEKEEPEGAVADGPPPRGCGCGHSAGVWPGALAALLLGLLRRGRGWRETR